MNSPLISRRSLLQAGGMLGMAAGVAAPMFFSRLAQATNVTSKKVLVVVYQRFGMDGLLAVTPYANESLRRLRPDLMLPAPDSGKANALLDLGEGYGLNPSLAALAPLYKEGALAFIQAAGSPHNTRSHLDAAQWWESGTPGNKATTDGWLNRAMSIAGNSEARALRAVSLTAEQPRVLYGAQPAVAITDLAKLQFGTAHADAHAQEYLRSLDQLYANSSASRVREAAEQGMTVMRALSVTAAQSKHSGAYPDTSFGRSMRDVATLIKADVGLQVAFSESRSGKEGQGSWDTHVQALDAGYQFGFPAIATDFAQTLAAFWQDLGNQRDNVALVTHTDFGRNVVQNDRHGTDHGRATTMMVLGTEIQGGQVHGKLPEVFATELLEDGMDLPVTTDFRSVLTALVGMQMDIPSALDSRLFPGFNERRFSLARSQARA